MTKGTSPRAPWRSAAAAAVSVVGLTLAVVGVGVVGVGALAGPGTSTADRASDHPASRLIAVRALHRGDLVVTDQGDVVRVRGKRLLENGRYVLRRTSPWRDDDRTYLIGTRRGYRPGQVFVVLRRSVPVEAVQHQRSPVPTFPPTTDPPATP